MTVRPVDSLTMLPRLNEAGRLVQQHEQHPYAFQHVLGTQIQEKAQRERMQVKQKAQVEQSAIQRDRQGGSGGQGAQPQGERRQGQPRQEAARTAARPAANGRLDVKV